MTQPPATLTFSAIDRSDRIRSTYTGIEDLADSIEHNGLIQPLVLSPKANSPDFILNAGGRRCAALDLLLVSGRWNGILEHGITCVPGKAGYVCRDEPGTELTNLMVEIDENLNRQDVSWQDNLMAICKAAKLIRREEHANGNMIVQRELGAIIGCGYQDLRAAEALYDDFKACPTDYAPATTIRNAYAILLKKNATFVMALTNSKTIKPAGKLLITAPDGVQIESSLVAEPEPSHFIEVPLTSMFVPGDWKNSGLAPASVDHIITDPDYGIPVERLEAGVQGAAEGVAQESVNHSLDEMQHLITRAWTWLKPNGFLIFFYDLDHHEKLQNMITASGFSVQRWPFIWHKTDYRSNAAPSHNTCKDMEYVMICRKPGATLRQVEMSSIFPCPGGSVVKELGHPFAKPRALWQKLFSLCCLKGQTVFDPCSGVGSMPLAAVEYGLNPIGCEINPDHYTRLLFNLQSEYQKLYGPNVKFT